MLGLLALETFPTRLMKKLLRAEDHPHMTEPAIRAC
jgi:hypothetical protein